MAVNNAMNLQPQDSTITEFLSETLRDVTTVSLYRVTTTMSVATGKNVHAATIRQ